jgi:LuxR family maltose regulon positive regulatory protein
LAANRSFEYADGAGVFVALKEHSRRAGTFWRAFLRQDGATRRAYLGRSGYLTLDRLVAAGRALLGELTPPVAAAPAATDQGGMLRARLGAPPMRRGCVARERLLDRLRDDDESLTLVVAPAGYGKTTLLAHWLTAGARRAVWLSLEPTDDDPRRFWESVLDGLDTLAPGVVVRARALLPALSVTGATAFLPTLLDDQATGLAADERGRPMVLVLDDYHVITTPLVHESIAALVERLPPTLRLVISGRESPPLPVPRLRARGRLIELRATDLAFTADETRRFLSETMRLAVDAETVVALAGRTEGWAAALQIAALGLRDRADPAAFVSSFRGSHRHVVDFLVTEVIDRQPAEIRDFLLRTAVLDQLSAPLCDAVLAVGDDEVTVRIDASDARPSSQAVLERLEDGGLFVAPLDDSRTRYRYHHLFAEVLLQRLRAEAPGLELTLRRRAAAWCEAAGLPAEAIEQALAGEDWERAARLIARLADPLWRQGDIATLERWMAALPANLARSRPQLALARAAIAYVSRDYHLLLHLEGELEDSLDHIGDASVEPDGASRGTVLRARASVLRAMAASLRGNGASARALAGEALAALPADDTEWRAFAQFQAYYLAHMSDDLNVAGRHAAESMALADAAGDRFLVVILLLQQAHLLHDRGRLTDAEAHLARARGVVERLGARGLPEAAALDNVAALVRYDRNDLAAVERLLSATWALPTAEGRSLLGFWAGTILARLRAAYGDFDGAYRALEEAEGSYRLAAPMDGTWNTWRAHVIPAWRGPREGGAGPQRAGGGWGAEAAGG